MDDKKIYIQTEQKKQFASENTTTKHNKSKTPDSKAYPLIIQEKITIPNKPHKIRKYIKGRLLGKGGFAKCYEITCEENNRVFAA